MTRRNGVIHFENTVTIRRPVDVVFDFVADFENTPRWNYHRLNREIRGRTGSRGTRYRQVRSTPRRSEESLEVTEYEPNRLVAVQGTLGPFDAVMTYRFEPDGDSTRLTNTAHLTAHGALRFAAPLAAGRIRGAVAANLGKLKEFLEGRS
jgi:uncharacterized protein YndB with AHSA1/START domain